MRMAILGGSGSIGMATASRIAQRGVGGWMLSRRRPTAALPQGVDRYRADVAAPGSLRDALLRKREILNTTE